MSASTIAGRLDELAAELDSWLRVFLRKCGPETARFEAMLTYPLGWTDEQLQQLDIAAPSGKRLRPAFTMLVCEAACGDARRALPAAAAVELIHNFSLVHDDIQDHSELRRNRPSVWSTWGPAQAINVGDCLFALAELAVLSGETTDSRRLVDASRAINRACIKLVEGQFLDIELQSSGMATLESYQQMVEGKTGALIECCARLGAIIAGASPQTIRLFGDFGRALGAAFQYQDDELGMWGDPRETGKSADSDLRSRKPSLPSVLALSERGAAADQFRAIFLRSAAMTDSEAARARSCLAELRIQERVVSLVADEYRQALATLAEIGPGADTRALEDLIALMAERRG